MIRSHFTALLAVLSLASAPHAAAESPSFEADHSLRASLADGARAFVHRDTAILLGLGAGGALLTLDAEDPAESATVLDRAWFEPGIDYGWPTAEGSACFTLEDEPAECDTTGMVPPVIEMPHDEVCSVIGGSVYRGAAIPEIDGMYFYSDFCGGFLRSFVFADGEVTEELQWFDAMGPVSSFAVDNAGELYITSTDGRLRKLVPAG